MDLAGALRLFVRTVEAGSMSAAARSLGVAQPSASKLLRGFEAHCGARLLERGPRGMTPTALGRQLYERASAPLGAIDEAVAALRNGAGEISGPLRLHSPFCLGERHLHRIAEEFRRRHPAVRVELMLGNDGVDLIGQGIDLAFGRRHASGGGVVRRRVGFARRVLVASPEYLERHGAPRTPETLLKHDLLVTDASLDDGLLTLVGAGGPIALNVSPALTTNSVQMLLSALVDGRGVGTAQVLLVAEDLVAGRLVRVLQDYEIRPSLIEVSYPTTRLQRPVVRAFIDHAVPAIRRLEGVD